MKVFLLEPVYWNWWILGLVLIIAEMLAPGTFMLWLGMAALTTGLMVWLFPAIGWQWQVLLFAVLTIVSIVFWWSYFRHRPVRSEDPLLNRRGHQYVGRVFTLEAPIVNGQGKIRVDDSFWKIVGTDCPAGTRVKVTGVEGVILKVKVDEKASSHAQQV